jgi:signal transduction histidine kinase
MIVYIFFYGISFGGLGLAAYLQLRRGGDFPLRKLLPWLASFGVSTAAASWVEMFVNIETNTRLIGILETVQIILQTTSGLLLLIFGLGMLTKLNPLPRWSIFIPGLLIVPFAYVMTYALSTFITPSPIQIPIDIWSRYLLYLPGSLMAGLGFLRQWSIQKKTGYLDVANLMLGAGIAFLVEAFVMGLVVPAAPYAPASYYNYDRTAFNAFSSAAESNGSLLGLPSWLDYQSVLSATGFPIQFWRMISAFAVTGFVVRGLDVFEAIQRRQVQALQDDRDRAQQAAIIAQSTGRQAAESWSNALVRISNQIAELENVDSILLYIVGTARQLFNADFIGLALVGDEPQQLALKYYASPQTSAIVPETVPINNKILLEVFQTSPQYMTGHIDEVVYPANSDHFPVESASEMIAVPLKISGNAVGVLWAANIGKRAFTDTDLIWLESLADQVMIAIKHGFLTSQLQSLSVMAERSRISREMHDGLAQVLGYVNLQVQTLDAFLKQGKLNRLQNKLDDMHKAVRSANADIRENILSLRTTLSNDKGVAQAVQEYLEEFGLQTHVKTHFDNHAGLDWNLSSLAEVQLVCILQEALTNVRKHAHAENVSVLITKKGQDDLEYITMSVMDDGVGLKDEVKKTSFGLQVMRERAESVGGTILVRSKEEGGTLVTCQIPVLKDEQSQKWTDLWEKDRK